VLESIDDNATGVPPDEEERRAGTHAAIVTTLTGPLPAPVRGHVQAQRLALPSAIWLAGRPDHGPRRLSTRWRSAGRGKKFAITGGTDDYAEAGGQLTEDGANRILDVRGVVG
jgi:hypothetical protein